MKIVEKIVETRFGSNCVEMRINFGTTFENKRKVILRMGKNRLVIVFV